jgi:hypothetical protein
MTQAAYNSWTSYLAQTIYAGPSTVSGVAIGDFDKDRVGNEVVVVSGTDVIEVYYDRGNWLTRLIYRDATLVLGVAVGDFDSGNPGEEVVTVGQSGKVVEVYGSGLHWNARLLYKDPMDLEHVVIDDVNSDGIREIVVGGSSGNLTIVSENGSAWNSQIIFTEPTGIAGIAIDDFDYSHNGKEIAVIGQRDGKIFEVFQNGSAWLSKLIWTNDKATPSQGLTCVAVGEYNTSSQSSGIVVGDAFGQVVGIQGSGTDWSATTICRFVGEVACTAVGDFNTTRYGDEIVVAEYDSHHVFQVSNSELGWTSQLMFTDLDAPEVLVIGDFYDDSKNAVIVAGFSRAATMLHEREPPLDEPIIEFEYTITFDSSPRVSPIMIDNVTYSPDQLPVSFTWLRGSYHFFNCSSRITSNTTNIRHTFASWNDGIRALTRELTVSEKRTYAAGYKTQFYLTVSSPLGSPEGEGWYDAGHKALVSTPAAVPTDDLLGHLGDQHSFESWRGGLYTNQPKALVLMHEPKTMWAVYRLDHTRSAVALTGILAVSASALVLTLFKLKRTALFKRTASTIRHTTAIKQGFLLLLILAALYKTLSTLGTPPTTAAGLSAVPGIGWIAYRLIYAKYSKRSADQTSE